MIDGALLILFGIAGGVAYGCGSLDTAIALVGMAIGLGVRAAVVRGVQSAKDRVSP